MRTLSLLALLTLTAATAGQDDLTVLPPDSAPRKMLYTYLRAEAQKHFDARRKEIAGLSTPEQVRKRQETLKAKFIESIGGFPAKTPLNARTVGKEQRAGYRIEKVIYESRPNHHVTATLYLPDGPAPYPGVIMPIGHSGTGKAADYVQRGSIALAKNGLAVLAYDPIGQGERRQLLEDGKPGIPSITSEHTLVGVGAILVGRSTASYRIWDGIRSLDYLVSRPEIDAKRLGCTGCSGGGTLTSYLMALDDRIVAAAPSCYITSLERLFDTIGPQDAEQNITGQVAFGMDHADYLNMRAPLPTLICAASRDFFDIQGTWTTFREASLMYGVMGHPEHVALAEFNTSHGYPKPQREAVVRWMRRWLLNKDDAPVEEDFPIAKYEDLQCTRSGQVLDDLKGISCFQLNVELAEQLSKQRGQAKTSNDSILDGVRRLIALPKKIAAVKFDAVDAKYGDIPIRKLIFHTEPGIAVPALHFHPGQNGKQLLVYLDGLGMHSDAVLQLAKDGQEVLTLDPRGMGETSPGGKPAPKSNFGADFKETFMALHLNRPLLGQRTYDVLAVLQTVAKPGQTLNLTATGMAAPIALHAAAFDERIAKVTLDRRVSWMQVVRTPITYNEMTNIVPGALAVYDLPDLVTLIAPRTVKTN